MPRRARTYQKLKLAFQLHTWSSKAIFDVRFSSLGNTPSWSVPAAVTNTVTREVTNHGHWLLAAPEAGRQGPVSGRSVSSASSFLAWGHFLWLRPHMVGGARGLPGVSLNLFYFFLGSLLWGHSFHQGVPSPNAITLVVQFQHRDFEGTHSDHSTPKGTSGSQSQWEFTAPWTGLFPIWKIRRDIIVLKNESLDVKFVLWWFFLISHKNDTDTDVFLGAVFQLLRKRSKLEIEFKRLSSPSFLRSICWRVLTSASRQDRQGRPVQGKGWGQFHLQSPCCPVREQSRDLVSLGGHDAALREDSLGAPWKHSL